MADSDPVNFTEASARKVASVVRRFRDIPPDCRGRHRATDSSSWFRARITGAELDDEADPPAWRHTAVEVFKKERGQNWEDHPEPREATGDPEQGGNGVWLYFHDNRQRGVGDVAWVQVVSFPDPDDAGGPYVNEWWGVDWGDETVWAVLGEFALDADNAHVRRYAWSEIIRSEQDAEDPTLGADSFATTGGRSGTTDENYAVDVGAVTTIPSPSSGFEGMFEYARPGAVVLLRRMTRREATIVDEGTGEYAVEDVPCWGFVRPAPPMNSQVIRPLNYDAETNSWTATRHMRYLFGRDGTAFGLPDDFPDVAPLGQYNTEEVILFNVHSIWGLQTGEDVVAAYLYSTTNGVKVYVTCTPSIRYGTIEYVSSVDFGSETVITIEQDVAVPTVPPT